MIECAFGGGTLMSLPTQDLEENTPLCAARAAVRSACGRSLFSGKCLVDGGMLCPHRFSLQGGKKTKGRCC